MMNAAVRLSQSKGTQSTREKTRCVPVEPTGGDSEEVVPTVEPGRDDVEVA